MPMERSVPAVPCQQLDMSAELDDATCMHDEDVICSFDRGQPVCNHENMLWQAANSTAPRIPKQNDQANGSRQPSRRR
jgi:hypothetical protein